MFSQLPVRTTGVLPPLKACSLNTVVVVVAVVVFVAATAHSAGQSGSGFKETFTVGDIERSFLHVLSDLSVGAVVPRNLWKALSRIYPVFSSGMNCDPHQLIKRDIPDVSLPKCTPALVSFLTIFADQ
jgi:hypothetical protein